MWLCLKPGCNLSTSSSVQRARPQFPLHRKQSNVSFLQLVVWFGSSEVFRGELLSFQEKIQVTVFTNQFFGMPGGLSWIASFHKLEYKLELKELDFSRFDPKPLGTPGQLASAKPKPTQAHPGTSFRGAPRRRLGVAAC